MENWILGPGSRSFTVSLTAVGANVRWLRLLGNKNHFSNVQVGKMQIKMVPTI